MFERILVPIELGDSDELVMHFLGGLQRYGTREVILLHSGLITGVEQAVAKRQETEIADMMADMAKVLAAEGIACRSILGPGKPVHDVVDVARIERVTLILTGTRGKSAINELTVGSTSEAIGRQSPVPALLLPFAVLEGQTPDAARWLGEHLMERVVLTTDFSDFSERTLDLVKSLHAHGLGTVYVTHVVNPREIREHKEAHIRSLRRELAAITSELLTIGIEAQAELGIGHVLEELRETAEYLDATCFMIGSRGRGLGEQILLGSVSQHIIRDAGRPVIVSH